MRATLGPILDLLDEGLRLYRRAFAPLMILAALAGVPLGLVVVALVIAADWLASGVGAFLVVAVLLIGLPVGLYITGALSRAAAMAADGSGVSLRAALQIGPLRVLGMGCYGTLFSLVASVAVGAVTTVCVCGAYVVVVAVVGAAISLGELGGVAGGAVAGFFAAVGVILFLLIYGLSLVINGAIYGSVVFVLQPFVHEGTRLGPAVRRSLDLLTFRLGHNLLTFLCASLVFSAAALALTVAVGVLVPLPALFLLGAESTVAQAISGAAWVAGISLALPLLPIWMALLYRRQVVAREGADLAERLERMVARA